MRLGSRAMRVLVLVLLVMVAGCSQQDVPWGERAPVVTGFTPATRPVGEAGQGVVTGRNLRPGYDATLDEEVPLKVLLGDSELPVVEVNAEGTRVVVQVPAYGAPGKKSVRVTTESGEDVLEDAYTVTE